MLTLTTDQQAALAKRQVMRRTFIYCIARDPDTGLPSPAGFWDDVGAVEFAGRTYYGSSLFSISTLSAKSDFTIPGLTITMSGVAPAAVALVRGDTVAQAPIEVSLGIFDVATHTILPPLIRRFVGFIDDVDIITPKAGDKSTITFTCESASRALTIKSVNTRSGSTHRQRAANDAFYDYTAGMRQKTIYFGRSGPAGPVLGVHGGGKGKGNGNGRGAP